MNIRNVRLKTLIVLSILVLQGCARMFAMETPYDKVSRFDNVGGYEETEIATRTYELKYYGNALTPREKIEAYWHRRAKELCRSEYTSEFKTLDRAMTGGSGPIPIYATGTLVTGIVKCASIEANKT